MTRQLKWLTQVTASEPAKFEEGIEVYSQKITNVAAGTTNADAVNYGQLTDHSSSLKSYVDAADQTIQTNINNASSSIKNYVDAADTAFQSNLNTVSGSIVSYVDAVDQIIQTNINNMSSSVVSYVDTGVQNIQTNINNVSSSLKTYVDAGDQVIQTNINNASSSIKAYVDAADTLIQQNINNVSSSVATSIAAEQTTRMGADEQLLKLDGSRSMNGDLNMGSQDITNVGSASFAGDLTVNGNLQVNGATTAFNTTEVQVTDKLITIANGSADSAAANGAGLEVDGAGVSLTYDSASSKWVSDIGLGVTAEASFDAAMKLSGSAFTNITTAITGNKYDVNDAIRSLETQQGYILSNLGKGYDALRYTTTGSFSAPAGEAATVTITLPTFFTSSMIDTVSIDVMVDQGVGWTNDLVSGKMYPSGSYINVDINAPAAQNGDKYRLIAIGNGSILDGVIYNNNSSNAGSLAGGTIVYAFNEVAVGSTIVGSPVNYSPQWNSSTNLSLISIDQNGVYGNALKFGTDQFGVSTAGTFEGHPGLGGTPTSNAAMAADLNMNIFTYSCTVDVWIKPIVVYPNASWDMPFFKIGGMGYSRDNYGGTSYGDGMFIRLVDQTINNEHCWLPQASCGWPAHGAGVTVDASSLGADSVVTKDVWTHIAVRKTVTSEPTFPSGVSVTLEIFVNGEKATGAIGQHFHYDNAALFWGIKPDYYLIGWEQSRPGFQGSMDQLRISDSALSDAEILAIYQAGSASLAAGGGAAGPGAYSSPASTGVGSGGLQGVLGNNPTSEWAKKICDNLNPVGGVIIFNKGSYWC